MHNPAIKLSVILAMVFLLASPALATEPAVAKINGKTGLTFGRVDGDSLYTLDGSVTIPIAKPAGVQIDAGFGQWDADAPTGDIDINRLGLHLFVRDPQLGRAGVFTSLNELEANGIDIDINQYGVEGEFYSAFQNSPLTFSALLGQYDSDPGDKDLLGTLDVKWYPLEELMIEIGGAIVDNNKKAHIGTEYQLLQSFASFMALSAYADLAVGEHSYDHALIGMRAYFGDPKSLVKRHREDTVNNTTDRLNPPLLQ